MYTVQRIEPIDIPKFWKDIIEPAVETVFFPGREQVDETGKANILKALLCGAATCFIGAEGQDSRYKIYYVMLTRIEQDFVTQKPYVLVIAMYGTRNLIPEGLWGEGLEAVRRHAREAGCTDIYAYTDSDRVVEMTTKFGANCKYRIINWSVEKENPDG